MKLCVVVSGVKISEESVLKPKSPKTSIRDKPSLEAQDVITLISISIEYSGYLGTDPWMRGWNTVRNETVLLITNRNVSSATICVVYFQIQPRGSTCFPTLIPNLMSRLLSRIRNYCRNNGTKNSF